MSAAGLFVTCMALVILWLVRRWSIERSVWNKARADRERTFRKLHEL